MADSGGTHPKASRNKRSKDEFLCEAVPASHTFQAVHFDTSVDQMPVLIDTNQLSAAVQACPVALDANVQTVVNGQVLTSQTIQVIKTFSFSKSRSIFFHPPRKSLQLILALLRSDVTFTWNRPPRLDFKMLCALVRTHLMRADR